MLVVWEEAGPKGFGRVVQWIVAFFYADDELLVPPCPSHLETESNVLMGIFYQVGLYTTVTKMVGILLQPFLMAGGHLEAAYERQMTGEGPLYRERQQDRSQ